jgi:hypothetical protein
MTIASMAMAGASKVCQRISPASVLGMGLIAAAAPAAYAQPCTTPVCLAPGPQSTNFAVPVPAPAGGPPLVRKVTSTARFQPISVWNMGGGNFDVAFTFPLVPVAVTYGPQTNGPPVNFSTVLNNPWGAYVGTGAPGQWNYAIAANPLPNQALEVTAYQVYAGPNYVGIRMDQQANGFSSGFAVLAPANLPNIPPGTGHWVQAVATNFPISGPRVGFGNVTSYLDNGGVNAANMATGVTSPYYDASYAADGTNFYDAPRRNNQANLNQSNWWIADLFLASGPGATGPTSRNAAPGAVILNNPGVQWGWGNFHLSLGGLGFGALRNLFAQDTSSVQNFELALDCDPSSCPLTPDITPTYLSQLDAAFNVAVPEPASWVMMIVGAGMVGAMARRRKTPLQA